ncbi:hypothetical protein JW796_04145 [Candidatus Dojkabacteria bacterium]|nr:hypothetical protein [Candidatus Dojkabacteria bacterium]
MLKKLIEPMQLVLLQKKYCPGCTRKLDSQRNRTGRSQTTEKVVCDCGRIFIYDKELDTYRRAAFQEV